MSRGNGKRLPLTLVISRTETGVNVRLKNAPEIFEVSTISVADAVGKLLMGHPDLFGVLCGFSHDPMTQGFLANPMNSLKYTVD
ncbi:hypothetical protein A2533_04775 [Candidatus Falkowbacteria bacterium RIFOXYD2_FULL_35_9]|uniref:Uncharacterized protein n=1 Tax=Candidatus Falkowbacteria bacterium RIFOXYC2_FULL_36_12 TaxID=1798002 RepID=A0A1F5SYG4_9BACT|nr:MAG: hypothetical protein A2300_02435 [Candidatus Falkowbacteria bacterium RIFOXYB2_FULL_35_7]OGF31689.1 MAG: hypothetical protein A2478_04340 [Candidatus Falkowbacteria bacterium RIFOXYC2_FULL_36_12]OGF33184.1 MAG: hypothetical protein A2223_04950 [Candidatus Falkowbacteria bacterium RIFOXYA2_FULL_35_8]OGF46169.1 MAG: hypothetical protein A2533_04775 [Candidatus Falkowbacteria bacterium RIFOXYD2_FULL_35_9]